MASASRNDSPELPDSGDETMDKMACIEAMLNRMEQTASSPSGSDAFLKRMLAMVNQEDLTKMVELQTHMMSRFEKTNEMLLNFNALSAARFETMSAEFKRHTQLLSSMKTDLDDIFKRIRILKRALSSQYPDAFKVCEVRHELPEEDEDEEEQEASRSRDIPTKTSPEAKVPASSKVMQGDTQVSQGHSASLDANNSRAANSSQNITSSAKIATSNGDNKQYSEAVAKIVNGE